MHIEKLIEETRQVEGEEDVVVSYEPAPKVNKQLFENRGLDTEAQVGYEMSEDRLHNDRTPNLGVVREQPVHRVMILLKAQGLSNTEIAKKLGCTGPWVSQVLRQPWARQRLLDELNQAGRPVIQSLLAGEAVNSIMTLIEVRDNASAKPSERAGAANSLLDRYLGKPVAIVEQHNITEPTSKDVDELDRELVRLEQEAKMLKGN